MSKLINEEYMDIAGSAANKGEAIEQMITNGCSFKDSLNYWKEYGAKTSSRGFKPTFYAYLREGIKSADEVKEFVTTNGSTNDVKYLSVYNGIADLANSIHSDKED